MFINLILIQKIKNKTTFDNPLAFNFLLFKNNLKNDLHLYLFCYSLSLTLHLGLRKLNK